MMNKKVKMMIIRAKIVIKIKKKKKIKMILKQINNHKLLNKKIRLWMK
jgi:hypothetical protein